MVCGSQKDPPPCRPDSARRAQFFSRRATQSATASPAAYVGLHQPVDHECRRHVDPVLAGIPAVPLDLAIEIGDREGLP